MPQASDELRARMEQYFGDTIGDQGPTAFLMVKGWKHSNGSWFKPALDYHPSLKEWECVEFLCAEWDDDFDPTKEAS